MTVAEVVKTYRVTGLPADYFDLVPPSAVRTSTFPPGLPHNAIWDFGHGHGGRLYASLCGELGAAVAAQVYEYDPDTGALSFCFDCGRETLAWPTAIPPSKTHTSIQPIRGGKVILTTHTTARSAVHPHWLFDAYYGHPWEGFPGSHVLVWDPDRREVRNLGIPVPRDSIYGATYDERHHALWFTTFLKGHLWRLDLARRELKDFGQTTEFGSWSIVKDRLGNLYTSSRSGHLFHIDVDRQTVRDLGTPADRPETNPLWSTHRVLAHHAAGPDGRLYVSFHFSEHLYAIDPVSLRIERTCSFVPEAHAMAPMAAQKGLAFDSQGVLWLATQRISNVNSGSVTHLYRWDLLRGGAPEALGMVGTPERTVHCVSEMLMDRRDVLHLADSNHADDPPGILAIDLPRAWNARGEPRQQAGDVTSYMLFSDGAAAYPGKSYAVDVEPYQRAFEGYAEFYRFVDLEANTTVRARAVAAVRLWEHLGRGQAGVKALRWQDDGSLIAWCGPEGRSRLRLSRSGDLVERPTDAADGPAAALLPGCLAAVRLPGRQGRQYLARPSCWARWNESLWLVGTADGVLARVDGQTGEVFGLGAVTLTGPIRNLVVDPVRQRAYGVGGGPMDLGMVFAYDDRQGVRELGRLFATPPGGIIHANSQPSACAVSPDGAVLAVGADDDLACVYLYTDPYTGGGDVWR